MTPGAVWELRATAGATTNGGCFDVANKGATGVDYSQQSSAQATGTVTSVTTTVTSTAGIFDNTMLGNCITDGTTFVIITAFTSSTIVTVDTSPSWTAASVKVGGSQKSIDKIFNKIVAGNAVWIKNDGGDSITAGRTLTAGTITAPIVIRGYNSVRGDIDNGSIASTHLATGFLDTTSFPVLAQGANTLTTGSNTSISGLKITSSLNGNTLRINSAGIYLFRCSISNTNSGSSAVCVSGGGSTIGGMKDCDVSCTTASGGFAINIGGVWYVEASRVASASGGGITTSGGTSIVSSLFYSMAASQTAVQITNVNTSILLSNCTFDSIVGTCLTLINSGQTGLQVEVSNCIFSNCGTGCNNLSSGTQLLRLSGGNNQFWSTTTPYTGWNNVTDATGYLNGDVQTGSNSNYVAQGSQNFRPSSTSNGINQGLPLGTTIGAFQLSSTGGGYQGTQDGLRD